MEIFQRKTFFNILFVSMLLLSLFANFLVNA